MLKYKEIMEDVKKIIEDTVETKIIYLNYNKPDGVKILDKIEEIENDFYKLIVFNEEIMKSFYHVDDGNYLVEEVRKKDFEEGSIEERTAYLEKCEYKKLKYKVGFMDCREIFQYCGLE